MTAGVARVAPPDPIDARALGVALFGLTFDRDAVIAARAATGAIVIASARAAALCGAGADALIGRRLADVLAAARCAAEVAHAAGDDGPLVLAHLAAPAPHGALAAMTARHQALTDELARRRAAAAAAHAHQRDARALARAILDGADAARAARVRSMRRDVIARVGDPLAALASIVAGTDGVASARAVLARLEAEVAALSFPSVEEARADIR